MTSSSNEEKGARLDSSGGETSMESGGGACRQETRHSEWDLECIVYHGRVLTGKHRHWCSDWDDLPIDETCDEWETCACYR